MSQEARISLLMFVSNKETVRQGTCEGAYNIGSAFFSPIVFAITVSSFGGVSMGGLTSCVHADQAIPFVFIVLNLLVKHRACHIAVLLSKLSHMIRACCLLQGVHIYCTAPLVVAAVLLVQL